MNSSDIQPGAYVKWSADTDKSLNEAFNNAFFGDDSEEKILLNSVDYDNVRMFASIEEKRFFLEKVCVLGHMQRDEKEGYSYCIREMEYNEGHYYLSVETSHNSFMYVLVTKMMEELEFLSYQKYPHIIRWKGNMVQALIISTLHINESGGKKLLMYSWEPVSRYDYIFDNL